MKESFKYLEAPCGDDSLTVEAGYMMQYLRDIKDYVKSRMGDKFEGRSSWELHKTAKALTDLWETAHAMSDAIAKLQCEMENLAYSREDEESYEAEEEAADKEHVGYMGSWYNGSRI